MPSPNVMHVVSASGYPTLCSARRLLYTSSFWCCPLIRFKLSLQCGHLVGHVRSDEGVTKRVSNCTPVPLGYHADNSDIVFLACRSQAKSGGMVACALPFVQELWLIKCWHALHGILACDCSADVYSITRVWAPCLKSDILSCWRCDIIAAMKASPAAAPRMRCTMRSSSSGPTSTR